MTVGVTLTLDEILRLSSVTRKWTLPRVQTAHSALSGNYLSKFRGRGMEFDEIRPYQAGDDVRTIDWRVTARMTETYTKLFREERERPIFIFIDQNATMKFGSRIAFKSIIAARIASMLAWSASASGDRVGAVIFDDERHSEIRPHPGKRGVVNIAKVLVDYSNKLHYKQRSNTPAWHDALRRAKHIIHPGSHIIFISDFRQPNEWTEKQFTLLKRHADVSLVYIYDALEQQPLPVGRYTISDGKHFHSFFSSERTQRPLQLEHVGKAEQFLDNMHKKHGVHTLKIATDAALEETLLYAFHPNAGRRRHG